MQEYTWRVFRSGKYCLKWSISVLSQVSTSIDSLSSGVNSKLTSSAATFDYLLSDYLKNAFYISVQLLFRHFSNGG